MPINFTGTQIKDTFDQILHIDGGPTASEKVVYSAAGVATALKVSTGSVAVDNIHLDGNTITTLNANGNLILDANGTGVVRSGNISLDGNTIGTLDTDGDLVLAPNGSGTVNIAAANITGGAITNVVFTGSFTGITLIESQAFHTVNGGDGLEIENTGIVADGTSTNIDINITPKGTGEVNIPKVDIDGGTIDSTTVGATTAASVRGTTVTATTSIGYPTGTGGTVTQLTSKSTGVTLNNISGQITMHNDTLNRNTGVSFTLTNSFIAATDVVLVNIASGATADTYTATVGAVGAGSCLIQLHNFLTGTDRGEAVVLNFVVIKGAHS